MESSSLEVDIYCKTLTKKERGYRLALHIMAFFSIILGIVGKSVPIHQTMDVLSVDMKKNSPPWELFHYIMRQMRKLEGCKRQFVVTDDKLIAPLPIDLIIYCWSGHGKSLKKCLQI